MILIGNAAVLQNCHVLYLLKTAKGLSTWVEDDVAAVWPMVDQSHGDLDSQDQLINQRIKLCVPRVITSFISYSHTLDWPWRT